MIPKKKTLTPAPAKAVAAMAAAYDDDSDLDVDLSSLEAIDLSTRDIIEVIEIAKSGSKSKSKSKATEAATSAIELGDGDYILLTPSPPGSLRAALASVHPPTNAKKAKHENDDDVMPKSAVMPILANAAGSPVKKRPPMGLTWEEEADIADSCLASIAEETARVRGPDPFLSLRPPSTGSILEKANSLESGDIVAIEVEEALPTSSRRLPPINPPPFIVRKEPISRAAAAAAAAPSRPTPSSPFARSSSRLTAVMGEDLPSVSDLTTLPVPMMTPFARTLLDTDHADRISQTSLTPAVTGSVRPTAKSGTSFPPLSMDSHRDVATANSRSSGTYRPRTYWILASAIVGAIGAVVGANLIDPSPLPKPVAPAAQIVPSTVVVAPSAHTLVFKESEGVSIPSPAAKPPAPPAVIAQPQQPAAAQSPPAKIVAAPTQAPRPVAPAPAPHRPAAPPKVSAPTPLVDGTLGMGNNKTTTPLAPTPSPSVKKKLTPEQELAEAQLRAAARSL